MKELETEFEGKGSTKGFHYLQIRISDMAYLYKVEDTEDNYSWYEIFRRVENKGGTYNIGGVDVFFEPKVSYPNDNSFGVTAWCCSSLERANAIFENIKNK